MSDLRMTRGDDVTFDIDVTDDDDQPVDLTVFEGIWFTAKRRISDADADAVIAKSLGAEIEVDTSDSTVTTYSRASVNVDAADTAGLPDHIVRLVWDVQVKDDMGKLVTIASGTLTVTPDVTRATGSDS